jgi:hypothetical protein
MPDKKKTALACPDDDYCADCAREGREEPLNVTVRHDLLHEGCVRMRWCSVCSNGSGTPIDCEGEE